jgi:hypothetical protein
MYLGGFSFCACGISVWSLDSSVGRALGYGLDDRGSRVQFPAEAGNFSLHCHIQNSSGAHPASYPTGTRGSFPGGKAAMAWSWPLTFILCWGQRMSGAIPPLPQYAFMAWCLVKAQGISVYFCNQLYKIFTYSLVSSCCCTLRIFISLSLEHTFIIFLCYLSFTFFYSKLSAAYIPLLAYQRLSQWCFWSS